MACVSAPVSTIAASTRSARACAAFLRCCASAIWVETVPRLIDEALTRWDLVLDGPARTGWTAVVVPVRRGAQRLALKVTWPHPEGRVEHLALRRWNGAGAVRLVAALPSEGLLLLERLDADHDLTAVWADDACALVGGLLARLHVPAPPQVPRIGPYLAPHLQRMAGRAAVPRRVVSRTQGLARDLLTGDVPEVLLHTDLHYENVLRSPDGRWLAIDPKPLAGHPGFEVWPLLRNRVDEMGTGSALRWSVRQTITRLTTLRAPSKASTPQNQRVAASGAGAEAASAAAAAPEGGATGCGGALERGAGF